MLYAWDGLLVVWPPPDCPDQDPAVVEVEWDVLRDPGGWAVLLHLPRRRSQRWDCGHVVEADIQPPPFSATVLHVVLQMMVAPAHLLLPWALLAIRTPALAV